MRSGFKILRRLRLSILGGEGHRWTVALGHRVERTLATRSNAACIVCIALPVWYRFGRLHRPNPRRPSQCLQSMRTHRLIEALCGQRGYMSTACLADFAVPRTRSTGTGRRRRVASQGAVRRLSDPTKVSIAMLRSRRVRYRRILVYARLGPGTVSVVRYR